MNNKVEIKSTIEFCSECPHCQISRAYSEDDNFEEIYDLMCWRLKENVHIGLNWYEIAKTHTNRKDSFDNIPDRCPLIKK